MSRFARSWQMAKTSFKVVGQDKELLWLPVLSVVASIAAMALIIVGGIAGGLLTAGEAGETSTSLDVVAMIFAFTLYLLLAFIQVYFHAATVSAANERLGGGDPTVGSALGAANKHLGRLFLWSLVVATVNVILQALRERGGMLGQIAAGIAGIAWNLATYFVVPILLFEKEGIGGSLKRSGHYFRKNWGEQVIGDAGIGLVGFLVIGFIVVLTVVAAMVVAPLGSVALGIIVGLGVLAALTAAAVFTVASAVYKTALYRFAAGHEPGGDFSAGELSHAFQPKHG